VTLTKDCVKKHCGLDCEAIGYLASRSRVLIQTAVCVYYKPQSGTGPDAQSLDTPAEGVSEWRNEPDADFDKGVGQAYREGERSRPVKTAHDQ